MKIDDRGAILCGNLKLVITSFIPCGFQSEMDGLDNQVPGWALPRQTRLEYEVRVARIALVIKGNLLQREVIDDRFDSTFRPFQMNADEAAMTDFLQPLAELVPLFDRYF